MLRISTEVSKLINKKALNCFQHSFRSIKFWSKNSSSSEPIVKNDEKVSLAYYSLDPHYLTSSKPNPIIIYHSLLTSKEMYQNSVRELADKTGRTVYLLDMRNHGESPHSTIDNSNLKDISKDVIDFMDEFSLNKAILIGNGVGSLAMLRTSLEFNDRVDKVVAIDILPMDLPFIGPKILDRMLFVVSALPQNISLSNAKLIVKQQLSQCFRDKTILQYILMNLIEDSNGFIKWRFNLPVIRQLMIKGIDRYNNSSDKQFTGKVLIVSGKYGSMTAHNYSQLKNSFPNSKFDFYQRHRHSLHLQKSKQLVKVMTRFIGNPNKIEE